MIKKREGSLSLLVERSKLSQLIRSQVAIACKPQQHHTNKNVYYILLGVQKLTRSGLNGVSERDVWKTYLSFSRLIKILYPTGENCVQNAHFYKQKGPCLQNPSKLDRVSFSTPDSPLFATSGSGTEEGRWGSCMIQTLLCKTICTTTLGAKPFSSGNVWCKTICTTTFGAKPFSSGNVRCKPFSSGNFGAKPFSSGNFWCKPFTPQVLVRNKALKFSWRLFE